MSQGSPDREPSDSESLRCVPDPAPLLADEPLLLSLLVAFGLLALAGAVLLSRYANPAGNAMAADRALFASVSALTLTGFELAPTAVRSLEPQGRCILSVLTLAGTLFALVAGGSLVSSLQGLGHSRRKIVLYSVGAVVCLSLLSGGFLMQPGDSLLTCLMVALSSLGNSGLNLASPWSIWDWRLHGVLLPLSILGGLGLPVLIEFAEGVAFGRPLSAWSRRMLTLCGIAYLAGFGLMLLVQGNMGSHLQEWVALASASSANAHSLGLPMVESPLRWPAVAWAMMLIMFLGAAPGGTAGGLRLTSIAAVVRGVCDLVAARPASRQLGVALAWIGVYLGLLAAGLLMLLMYEPGMSSDRLAFLAVSAMGNVGLSHDPVNLTGGSLYLLTACMLAGRLCPILFAWGLLRRGCRDAVVA